MRSTMALVLWTLIGIATLRPAVMAQAGGGWTPLFDGSSLKGWNVVGNANWQVAGGVIQASTGNGFLVTPASYADFQITLDFWVSDDANSGVFIRCSDPKTISQVTAYEVNIFDQRPDQTYRTGGIVDLAKPASVVMTGGKWNTFDITARGSKITVVLNGTTMVDLNDTKHARGPIALQYGAGTVRFRNVRVRTL